MTQPSARQLEDLERSAWADLVGNAPAAVRHQLGLRVEACGDALVLAASEAESILLNRAIGGTPDLRRAAERFRELGIGRFFLQPSAGDDRADVREALAAGGFVPYHRSWVKFWRDVSPPPDLSTELPLAEARHSDAERCGRILCEAFDLPSTFAPAFAALVGRPGWQVHAAYDGDEPVAVGLLYVIGGGASCFMGATRPSHRGRGAQGALMARRIRIAAALGCRWLTTETGEHIEGETSHSYNNMLRCGFEPAVVRPNFVAESSTRAAAGTGAAERRT